MRRISSGVATVMVALYVTASLPAISHNPLIAGNNNKAGVTSVSLPLPKITQVAVAPAPIPAPPKPAVLYPVALNLKVTNGDTLSDLLTDTGISSADAQHAIESLKPFYDPKRLDIGQTVSVKLDKGSDGLPMLASLALDMSTTSTVEVTRAGNDFRVKKLDIPVERSLARAGGRINSSLYETGLASGLPVSLVQEIIDAYSYDVDFQREIQQGDTMDVMFERMQTSEGTTAGHGNMIYAELILSGKPLKIYRYVDKTGMADYYNEKGESVRKALLRTPVNGARITSRFGMRNHPILGYSKMHRGIDFGAAKGTPIYAAGDGIVEMAGVKGGYGNYLRIRHNNSYSSAYGHISRFASGLKPGQKVKQGQVVAYVGSTGMATGPHLHYEILVNGAQVNPNSIKFKTGSVLKGKEMAAFKQNIEKIESKLASLPRVKTDVASLAPSSGSPRTN